MYQYTVVTDLAQEPITLQMAKDFLGIDFNDFDSLITVLITSARRASERVTGKAYGPKVIKVTGNQYVDSTGKIARVFPVTPFVSNRVWYGENENIDYKYNAGFVDCPEDLKIAILMRVATGFAVRENGMTTAMNATVNASIITERQYVTLLGI